ncbi:OLC1v1030394C1 [Oldenlandia corymbosa var. corymbosa]|uniref:OLC1v1030394C1 n=1 Tax=Oldenlandia corymbosa var. corymbosa TaxID=529605 RepID=A0AAV1CGS6_OLDCO|nr:OLC1v1030394C1 [Oldenlandia corymbosa var. corymbosa]
MSLQNSENQTLYGIHQRVMDLHVWETVEKSRRSNRAKSIRRCILQLLATGKDLEAFERNRRSSSTDGPEQFFQFEGHQSNVGSDLLCFRLRGLIEITKFFKDLRHKHPFWMYSTPRVEGYTRRKWICTRRGAVVWLRPDSSASGVAGGGDDGEEEIERRGG